MNRVVHVLLKGFIRRGALRVRWAEGELTRYGEAEAFAPLIHFTTRRAETNFLRNPQLTLGEEYMNGGMVLEEGTVYDLLWVMSVNINGRTSPWVRALSSVRYAARRVHQRNSLRRARRNVAHHYDLDRHFYELMLDPDMQYSCAYFENADQSLEEAQLAKKRHLAAKLLVDVDHDVLDIGCGWGGLGLYLAGVTGAKVHGITLSKEQQAAASERARALGLSDRASYRLQDYRDVAESFDRIISVGMFEHVGVGYYDAYFKACAARLRPRGVMMLHSIGRTGEPGSTNPFIDKYIFPGGYIPSLSEVLPVIERSGLIVTDVEILRLHYAETLKAWRESFERQREEIVSIYDERFFRMFEFYLAGSETAFRIGSMMVFQIQLAHRQDAVPLTRDYIVERERELRELESASLIVSAPHKAMVKS